MSLLILGLLLFLGVHSARIVADAARSRFIAQHGANAWKGLYTLASLAGFVLIVVGFGAARAQPVPLWTPIRGMAHLAALLTLPAFIMIVAAYVPGNAIKVKLKHPMVLGLKTWALAHLLANHTLADVLLFGSFLVWAVFSFRAAKARDAAAGTVYIAGPASRTAITVAAGTVAWALFAFILHGPLIGVRPFG